MTLKITLSPALVAAAERSYQSRPDNCSALSRRAAQSFAMAKQTPGLNPHSMRITPNKP